MCISSNSPSLSECLPFRPISTITFLRLFLSKFDNDPHTAKYNSQFLALILTEPACGITDYSLLPETLSSVGFWAITISSVSPYLTSGSFWDSTTDTHVLFPHFFQVFALDIMSQWCLPILLVLVRILQRNRTLRIYICVCVCVCVCMCVYVYIYVCTYIYIYISCISCVYIYTCVCVCIP